MSTETMGDIIQKSKRGFSSYKLNKGTPGTIEIPVIGMKAIQEGYIDTDCIDWMKMDEKDIDSRTKVKSGDLILTVRGTSIKAAVAEESVDGYALSNNVMAFTLSSKMKPQVIAAYLNSPLGQRELTKVAGGTTMLTLSTKQLEKVPIPSIPHGKQENLSNFIKLAKDYRSSLTKEMELFDKMVESYIVNQMECKS